LPSPHSRGPSKGRQRLRLHRIRARPRRLSERNTRAGFSKKEEGTLKFDDANERLVFFGKEGKERFGIPYGALQAVSPESEWAGSTTGTVVKNAPVIGAGTLGSLLKEKRRYLVIEFFDHNEARVTTSFRVDDKELLGAVIQALGEKAELTAQGDAFYRQRR
jgi:hypothetical protein